MGLSSRWKTALQATPALIAVVAALFQYWGILAQYLIVFTVLIPALIAVIFVLNDHDERSSHRDFFRYQVFEELISIRQIVRNTILVFQFIPHRFWRSMSEEDKKEMLGKNDYELLHALHKKITDWNMTYQNATTQQLADPSCEESLHQITHELEQLFDRLPWLAAMRNRMH